MLVATGTLILAGQVLAEDESDVIEIERRRTDAAALNEDPEAQRRARALASDNVSDEVDLDVGKPQSKTSLEFYGSACVHVINTYDLETDNQSTKVGDGNLKAGIRGEWDFRPGWYLYGRGEVGGDFFENYTTRNPTFDDDKIDVRLAYVSVDQEKFSFVAGKNWSA